MIYEILLNDTKYLEISVSVGQFVGNGGVLFRISAE